MYNRAGAARSGCKLEDLAVASYKKANTLAMDCDLQPLKE